MQGFIVTATTRIWQLAAINLFAAVLCIVGFGVFGIAPAITATLWATARLEDTRVGELIPAMWRQFRAEFVRANLVVWPHVTLMVALVWLGLIGGGVLAGLLFAFAIMVAAHLLAGLFAISQLSGTTGDAFANARLGLALAPYGYLIALACAPALIWAAWQQPLLGVYFGLSGFAWLINALVAPALRCAMPTPTSLSQEASR